MIYNVFSSLNIKLLLIAVDIQKHVFTANQRSFSAFVYSGSCLNIFISSVKVIDQEQSC